MQKIIEVEQHLLFFIDFIRVPKYRVRPILEINHAKSMNKLKETNNSYYRSDAIFWHAKKIDKK